MHSDYMARPPKTLRWYRGRSPPKPPSGGYQYILVVDDTISTGRTMHHAVRFVREAFPAATVASCVWRAPEVGDADIIMDIGFVPLCWEWGVETD